MVAAPAAPSIVAPSIATPSIATSSTSQPARASAQHRASFFDHLLSELNPLQYVPVVGTIYRAMTGDVIPESARFAGSLVVSGLTSGPIGLAITLGASALERLTGVDPEAIGTTMLADIGIGGGKTMPAQTDAKAKAKTKAVPAASAAQPAPIAAQPAVDAGGAHPWSVAQLTAYGVVRGEDGALARGAVSGADVLNGLELTRLGHTDTGAAFAAVA